MFVGSDLFNTALAHVFCGWDAYGKDRAPRLITANVGSRLSR